MEGVSQIDDHQGVQLFHFKKNKIINHLKIKRLWNVRYVK